MSIESLITESLNKAWGQYESGGLEFCSGHLPSNIIDAVESILKNDSAPNRQMLLAIAAGTVNDPATNPAALQLAAGLDRRGQAYAVRNALMQFRLAHGLTLKISQDAGVSNQWREPEITLDWVQRRRKQDQDWAAGFLTIVCWLAECDSLRRAKILLDEISAKLIAQIIGNSYEYPKFGVTPKIAAGLIREFVDNAPDGPDAFEAVVTVAARILASAFAVRINVERRDINSFFRHHPPRNNNSSIQTKLCHSGNYLMLNFG